MDCLYNKYIKFNKHAMAQHGLGVIYKLAKMTCTTCKLSDQKKNLVI